MTLDFGEYRYNAEYEGMVKNDTFSHEREQTIYIHFDKARFKITGQFLQLMVGIVAVTLAVYGISKVRKF